jgi:hypothetical protein
VCLGDSAHKITPHTCASGMFYIETAAAFANEIFQLAVESRNVDGGKSPTLSQAEAVLRQYESGPNNLHRRVAENIKASGDLARFSTLKPLSQRLLVHCFVPMSINSRDLLCGVSAGAPRIEYLTMSFNPMHGMRQREKKWRGAVFEMPLLIIAVVCPQS